MSSSPTLGSKLRVLVAKSFKAEKLYGSMCRDSAEEQNNIKDRIANEVRAKEWQRSYYQLRLAINALISKPTGLSLTEELRKIRLGFIKRSEESLREVERGVAAISEAVARQEFALVYKASLDMICYKARAQACLVAAEEIASLLEGRDKKNQSAKGEDVYDLDELENQINNPEPKVVNSSPKVVSIMKRASSGSRRGR